MNRYLNWYGRVALLGTPTSDGRTINTLKMERFHVPVLYRTPPPLTVMHLGLCDRLRVFGPGLRGEGAAWANLVLDIDRLPRPAANLYPEIDVDRDGALVGIWLGTAPAWPSLKPVIEVSPDE